MKYVLKIKFKNIENTKMKVLLTDVRSNKRGHGPEAHRDKSALRETMEMAITPHCSSLINC